MAHPPTLAWYACWSGSRCVTSNNAGKIACPRAVVQPKAALCFIWHVLLLVCAAYGSPLPFHRKLRGTGQLPPLLPLHSLSQMLANKGLSCSTAILVYCTSKVLLWLLLPPSVAAPHPFASAAMCCCVGVCCELITTAPLLPTASKWATTATSSSAPPGSDTAKQRLTTVLQSVV
jgi:hypothetical protein